jgi:tripartite-type tricarboxylate transporter receptor subunit TctC
MRFLVPALLALSSTTALAALPDTLTFYSPNPAGTQTVACRTLAKLYDEKYGTTSTVAFKPGVAGVLAMKEMLADKKFAMLCSGISESVINTSVYPGYEEDHKQLTMVSVVALSPTVFSTSASSKFSSLPEMLKAGKPITVGYHSSSLQFVAKAALAGAPVIWIPFKAGADGVPSLVDGSLDLYVDGGALSALIAAGKLKSLGHINGPAATAGPDISKQYPAAAKLQIITAISTSTKNKPADIEEMNKRIVPLTKHPEFIAAMDKVSNTPVQMSVVESNSVIEHFRKEFYK